MILRQKSHTARLSTSRIKAVAIFSSSVNQLSRLPILNLHQLLSMLLTMKVYQWHRSHLSTKAMLPKMLRYANIYVRILPAQIIIKQSIIL